MALARRLLKSVDEKVREALLDRRSGEVLESLPRDDISDLIEVLQDETDGPGSPSDKQIVYIRSLAEGAGFSEEGAADRIGADGFSDLTGGRDGSESRLIELLREARPRTGKQLEFIANLTEQDGLDEHVVCEFMDKRCYADLTDRRRRRNGRQAHRGAHREARSIVSQVVSRVASVPHAGEGSPFPECQRKR